MTRILGNILCATLLGVACISVLLWARSLMTTEGLFAAHNFHRYALVSGEAALEFSSGAYEFDGEAARRNFLGEEPGAAANERRWRFGFATDIAAQRESTDLSTGLDVEQFTWDMNHSWSSTGVYYTHHSFDVPYWMIVLPAGVPGAIWLTRRLKTRQERIQRGLCRRCGFELGDTYHCCPQCGERAPLPPAAPAAAPRTPEPAENTVAS
jgi:hypothetical protein